MLRVLSGTVAQCRITDWVEEAHHKIMKRNAFDPVLLVWYDHYPYMNFGLINLANHVTIDCLPPQSINKMKSLDVSVEDFL